MLSSGGSPQPRDQIRVSSLAGGFFTTDPPGKPPVNAHIQLLNQSIYFFFSFCLGYLNLPEQSGCVNSSNILDLTFQLIALTVPWPLCRHDPKDVESRGITLPTGHDESLILKLFYNNGFCLLKKIKNHVSSYTVVPKLNIQNGWRCPRPPRRQEALPHIWRVLDWSRKPFLWVHLPPLSLSFHLYESLTVLITTKTKLIIASWNVV